MMDVILHAKHELDRLTEKSIPVSVFLKTGVLDEVSRIKYSVGNDDLTPIEALKEKITKTVESLLDSYKN